MVKKLESLDDLEGSKNAPHVDELLRPSARLPKGCAFEKVLKENGGVYPEYTLSVDGGIALYPINRKSFGLPESAKTLLGWIEGLAKAFNIPVPKLYFLQRDEDEKIAGGFFFDRNHGCIVINGPSIKDCFKDIVTILRILAIATHEFAHGLYSESLFAQQPVDLRSDNLDGLGTLWTDRFKHGIDSRMEEMFCDAFALYYRPRAGFEGADMNAALNTTILDIYGQNLDNEPWAVRVPEYRLNRDSKTHLSPEERKKFNVPEEDIIKRLENVRLNSSEAEYAKAVVAAAVDHCKGYCAKHPPRAGMALSS